MASEAPTTGRLVPATSARPWPLVDDMVAVLRTVEWAAETDAEEGGRVDACPCCGSEKRNGHGAHCSLANVLVRAEGT